MGILTLTWIGTGTGTGTGTGCNNCPVCSGWAMLAKLEGNSP